MADMSEDTSAAPQSTNVFARTMPIVDWLSHYQMSCLRPDLLRRAGTGRADAGRDGG
jgi:hypothetical protein